MANTTDKSQEDVTRKSNQVTTALSRNNNTGKEIKSVIPRERYCSLKKTYMVINFFKRNY